MIPIRNKRKKLKNSVNVVRVKESDIEYALKNRTDIAIWNGKCRINEHGQLVHLYDEWAIWSSDFNIISDTDKVFLANKRQIKRWLKTLKNDLGYKIAKCDIDFYKLCELALEKLEKHPERDELLSLIVESEDIVSTGL